MSFRRRPRHFQYEPRVVRSIYDPGCWEYRIVETCWTDDGRQVPYTVGMGNRGWQSVYGGGGSYRDKEACLNDAKLVCLAYAERDF